MKTIVTGGAGFIGSHLTEYLLGQGDDVVVLDDLSTGSLRNLRHVIDHPGLRVVEGSVLDAPLVHQTLRGADRVFHLAAAVGVKLIVEEPLTCLRTNIHGTENILEASLAAGASLLLASTSEIYGKNTADRLSESADRILGDPLKSRWTYAASKGIDEAFAHAYWSEYGLEVAIVRLFNTIGPRQTGRYGMVVPSLIGQAQRGETLTVFGDGRQTRCFSYVKDVVPAMVRIAETPAARGRAVNLGGAEEVAILDLAYRIITILGSSSTVSLVPYTQAYASGYEDMRRRVPDNSLAFELAGYAPTTALDDVIRIVADATRDGRVNESMPQASGRPDGSVLELAVN